MNPSRGDIFTLLVDNEFGVLTRITALIRRAGWNIRSLAVAETAVPEISRLTVCLECRHNSLESVLDRLGRQSCVRSISVFSEEDQVARELSLIRVASSDREALERFAEKWGAVLVCSSEEERVYQVCCQPQGTDAMLEECKAIGLRDVARTGTVALALGEREGEETR